ncbi:hypothetical protein Pcinc_032078 [Petrolisthes cinctipes]|uniref:Uncharacterized protein n=1 Tax=Petrolisthes cinctipes TaxID=88211 RepID=A0AAE1EUU2_PETCI|nr:hypothetical protein Pcinc_032078 [Petrolisthes cinctipes]
MRNSPDLPEALSPKALSAATQETLQDSVPVLHICLSPAEGDKSHATTGKTVNLRAMCPHLLPLPSPPAMGRGSGERWQLVW